MLKDNKKQPEPKLTSTEVLWNEVIFFIDTADPLNCIEQLTYLLTENHVTGDGRFKPDEYRDFYAVIRLLTQIARLPKKSLKLV
ncbi:MAG: hypothetical protein JWP44_2634 [Mucilaginibacter sp.]|nr:hypothetical protein [Mucilaginibacter sp.]